MSMAVKLIDANGNYEMIDIDLSEDGNIVDTNLAPGHRFASEEIETAWKDDQFEQRLWDCLEDGEFEFEIENVTVTVYGNM
jgi:hypothetical protein